MTAETGTEQWDTKSTEPVAFHRQRPVAAEAARGARGSPRDLEEVHGAALAAAASPDRGRDWTRGRGRGRAVSPAAELRAAAASCLFSTGVSFSFFAALSSSCLDAVFSHAPLLRLYLGLVF